MTLAIVSLVACGPSLPRSETTLPLPGPAPRPRSSTSDPERDNRSCTRCHVEIAREWERSAHHTAHADAIFEAAIALEPSAFCSGCHAPELSPRVSRTVARELGVACISCHLVGDRIVAARVSGRAPHPVTADPRLATTAACGSCHQFAFPNRKDVPMQDTLHEHAASRFADRPCQSCHMPRVLGEAGRPHALHGTTVSAEMIRGALRVEVNRTAAGEVEVRLGAGEVGHSVPTGDLFRRIEVGAQIVDDSGATLDEVAPQVLARSFVTRLTEAGTIRTPISDTRVPAPGTAPPREVVLLLAPEHTARPVRWRISYLRMEVNMAEVFGVPDQRNRFTLFEGILLPVGDR